MQNIRISKQGENFQIEGFPNAAKVIEISGPKAKKLADLKLNKIDLEFAKLSLDKIRSIPVKISDPEEAYWRSAIIFFIKCFGGNNGRSDLKEKVVYKDESALECFRYFKDLRRKHLVHDENPYAQAMPLAILNKPDNPVKVAKIIVASFIAGTCDADSLRNLYQLIEIAEKYVEKQSDTLCEHLTSELTAKPYSVLSKMPDAPFTAPKADEVGKIRSSRP